VFKGDSNGLVIGDGPEIFALVDSTLEVQNSLAGDLREHYLGAQVVDVARITEQDWSPPPSSVIISVLDCDQAYVASLSDTGFAALKAVIQRAQQIP
jgi:hypothetical protein